MKAFLEAQPALESLADNAVEGGNGVFTVAVPKSPFTVHVIRVGPKDWIGVLHYRKAAANQLGALVPKAVRGDSKIDGAFAIVSSSAGSLAADEKLKSWFDSNVFTADFRPPESVPVEWAPGAGLRIYAQVQAGKTGVFGKFKEANLMPAGPLWVVGTAAQVVSDEAISAAKSSSLSLTFTPKPRTFQFGRSMQNALALGKLLPLEKLTSHPPTLVPGVVTLTMGAQLDGESTKFQVSAVQTDSKLQLAQGFHFALPSTTYAFDVTLSNADGADTQDFSVAITGKTTHGSLDLGNGWSIGSAFVAGRIGNKRVAAAGAAPKNDVSFGVELGLKIVNNNSSATLVFGAAGAHEVGDVAFSLRDGRNLFLPGTQLKIDNYDVAFNPTTQKGWGIGQVIIGKSKGSLAMMFEQALPPLVFASIESVPIGDLVGMKSPAGLEKFILTLNGRDASCQIDSDSMPEKIRHMLLGAGLPDRMNAEVGKGVGLIASYELPKDKRNALKLPAGQMLFVGSLDPESKVFSLHSKLSNSSLDLPGGVKATNPTALLRIDMKEPPAFEVGMGVTVEGVLKQPIEGEFLVGVAAGQSTLEFAGKYHGSLDLIPDITVHRPAVSFKLPGPTPSSLTLAINGGGKIKDTEFEKASMAASVDVTAGGAVTALAMGFKSKQAVSPLLQLELAAVLARSITSLGPPFNAADTVVKELERVAEVLPIPFFDNPDIYIATPGIQCPGEEPGPVVRLAGTATIRSLGLSLGSTTSKLSPSDLSMSVVVKLEELKKLSVPKELLNFSDATFRLHCKMDPTTVLEKLEVSMKGQGSILGLSTKVELQWKPDKMILAGAASAGWLGGIAITCNVDKRGNGSIIATLNADLQGAIRKALQDTIRNGAFLNEVRKSSGALADAVDAAAQAAGGLAHAIPITIDKASLSGSLKNWNPGVQADVEGSVVGVRFSPSLKLALDKPDEMITELVKNLVGKLDPSKFVGVAVDETVRWAGAASSATRTASLSAVKNAETALEDGANYIVKAAEELTSLFGDGEDEKAEKERAKKLAKERAQRKKEIAPVLENLSQDWQRDATYKNAPPGAPLIYGRRYVLQNQDDTTKEDEAKWKKRYKQMAEDGKVTKDREPFGLLKGGPILGKPVMGGFLDTNGYSTLKDQFCQVSTYFSSTRTRDDTGVWMLLPATKDRRLGEEVLSGDEVHLVNMWPGTTASDIPGIASLRGAFGGYLNSSIIDPLSNPLLLLGGAPTSGSKEPPKDGRYFVSTTAQIPTQQPKSACWKIELRSGKPGDRIASSSDFTLNNMKLLSTGRGYLSTYGYDCEHYIHSAYKEVRCRDKTDTGTSYWRAFERPTLEMRERKSKQPPLSPEQLKAWTAAYEFLQGAKDVHQDRKLSVGAIPAAGR